MLTDSTTKLQYFFPNRLLTFCAGLFAACTLPWFKNFLIRHFIKAYHVNMSEALHESPEAYPTFNDFFIRPLKLTSRPKAKAALLCPVDGIISEVGNIQQGRLIQAKRRTYTLQSLLHLERDEAALWEGGQFITLYLSPKDYHRIHMPLTGTVTKVHYIPGRLFSVKPATARTIPNLFSQNERVTVQFSTAFGNIVMVLVGATVVGKIATTWHGEFKRTRAPMCLTYNPLSCALTLQQGDEMGYFKLGSTVILILSPECPIQLSASLQAHQPVRVFESLVSGG